MRLKDVLYLLSIYVDVECQVYCDFSLKGTASPNKVFKMFLIPDLSCILDFRIDGKSHLIHEYKTGAEGGEGTIKVQLARVLYKKDDNYIPYTFGSPKYLFIDTETTGLPEEEENYEPSYLDFNYWPYIVQVGYVVFDGKWNKISENSYIVSPDNYNIPLSSTRIHKITHEDAKRKGVKREDVFNYLNDLLSKVDYIIGHNVKFDINVLKCEIMRIKRKGKLKGGAEGEQYQGCFPLCLCRAVFQQQGKQQQADNNHCRVADKQAAAHEGSGKHQRDKQQEAFFRLLLPSAGLPDCRKQQQDDQQRVNDIDKVIAVSFRNSFPAHMNGDTGLISQPVKKVIHEVNQRRKTSGSV